MIIVSILSHKVTYKNISVHIYIYIYIYLFIYIYIHICIFFFLSKFNRFCSLSCCMSFVSIFALKTPQKNQNWNEVIFNLEEKNLDYFYHWFVIDTLKKAWNGFTFICQKCNLMIRIWSQRLYTKQNT